MNVMAEAHKRTKAFIAKGDCLMTYAAVLRVILRHCHSEFKAMQKVKTQPTIKLAVIGLTLEVEKDATWFSLEGTATDSEGNKIVIGEGGSHAYVVQHGADWYFCRDNGFTNIELYACRWDYKSDKESFKIIR